MEMNTEKILKQRHENDKEMQRLKDINWELTNRLCFINGVCQHCKNWHYPHCGDK